MNTSAHRKAPSRFAAFAARWKDRLARSRQVFLLSLIVACGIEVAVDWNSTLFEINVLRGRVRERGVSYVHILAGASDEAMARRDAKTLASVSEGLFFDEDVTFVRFVDGEAGVVYEQLAPAYGRAFRAERGTDFPAYFAKHLTRDVNGVMHDPAGQQQRMANSRYRDFPQRWNDMVKAAVALFVEPPPARAGGDLVLFQEALRTAEREREGRVTWAFGAVRRPGTGELVGAVLVAFDMERTNQAIFNKYLKGLGMVLFFIGLILFQNLSSRQAKLRLLELERRYAAAKAALREALPAPVQAGALWAGGAVDQAEGAVDGQLFALHASPAGAIDLLLIDPDGEGIEAAAVALQVRQAFLARRAQGAAVDLAAEAAALGQIAAQIPLNRPLGLFLAHLEESGALRALAGPNGGARVLAGEACREPAAAPGPEAPAGIIGPLRSLEATIAPGEALLMASAGLGAPAGPKGLDVDALASFVQRSSGAQPPRAEALADALQWARGRASSLAARDLAAVLLGRRA